jgi:hypothetical protein
MPVIIQKEWYTKEQIIANRDILFLFGDNAERIGKGGQAKVCRDEPNCIGVVTKNKASHGNETDYLTDHYLGRNIMLITRDFIPIVYKLQQGGTVIFPADGIGTGLAMLEEKAPQTFMFVRTMWDYCVWIGEQYATK